MDTLPPDEDSGGTGLLACCNQFIISVYRQDLYGDIRACARGSPRTRAGEPANVSKGIAED